MEGNNSLTYVTMEAETMTSDSSPRKLGCSTSRCIVGENNFRVSAHVCSHTLADPREGEARDARPLLGRIICSASCSFEKKLSK